MLCPEIKRYLEIAKGFSFFYAVGDESYLNVFNELKQSGLDVIRVSDFCNKDDKFPDIDAIVDHFHTLDIDYKNNRFVLIGLGEYLALRGSNEAKQTLRRLKGVTLGNARVVILLRGIIMSLRDIVNEDTRIVSKNLVAFSDDLTSNIKVVNNKVIAVKSGSGIKNLLIKLEDGQFGNVEMCSMLNFEKSIYPVIVIDNPYSALIKTYTKFPLKERYGKSEQWSRLLEVYERKPEDVRQYFSTYINYENDIYEHVIGENYRNWLYFINLKLHTDRIQNQYLQYVVETTDEFGELKDKILIDIIRVPHTDKRFKLLYTDRKKLIKNFPESEIAFFENENQINPTEEIYRYTNNTELEKRRIISWVAKNGWNDAVADIYPELGMYYKKYIFDCGSLSTTLTKYFECYKKLKIENKVTDEFLKLVVEHGRSFTYAKLQTRDSAVNKVENKNTSFLYWIDALGVEYLSYIIELANKKGLSVHVEVARADLPTITSINRAFYEKWPDGMKYKEEELDDTKHKEKGGYFYTKDKTPVHLVKELEIIKRAIETAVSALALHECRQFVIASDHGASRLAVIREQENPHPTDTRGEHSGRCCKAYEESDRSFVVEENGYFVRSDYERYSGSRAANVEVHGGASLEEIVVPIITLKLKKETQIEIRVMNKDALQADRHDGTLVELYISDVEHISNVTVVVDGNKYVATSKDKSHYSVLLSEIKRQKTCKAEIYDGSDLINTIVLEIKGKTAGVNSDFDDLF